MLDVGGDIESFFPYPKDKPEKTYQGRRILTCIFTYENCEVYIPSFGGVNSKSYGEFPFYSHCF
jgi:hypothetical protein